MDRSIHRYINRCIDIDREREREQECDGNSGRRSLVLHHGHRDFRDCDFAAEKSRGFLGLAGVYMNSAARVSQEFRERCYRV